MPILTNRRDTSKVKKQSKTKQNGELVWQELHATGRANADAPESQAVQRGAEHGGPERHSAAHLSALARVRVDGRVARRRHQGAQVSCGIHARSSQGGGQLRRLGAPIALSLKIYC